MKIAEEQMVQQILEWFKDSPVEQQKDFIDRPKDELIMYHGTLGRNIRNCFRLWETEWTPEIDDSGADCSPDHPDARSMKLIEEVWRRLNDKD